MSLEIVTTARVEKGRFKVRNWERIQARLARCRDGEFVITIQRKHAIRTLAMNALYWGVYVKELSEYTGFTPDEMHFWLKAKFLPKKLAVANSNGEVVGEYVLGGSTTRLNKIEFGDYLREIKQWAQDALGVVIPEPEERAA